MGKSFQETEAHEQTEISKSSKHRAALRIDLQIEDVLRIQPRPSGRPSNPQQPNGGAHMIITGVWGMSYPANIQRRHGTEDW